MTNEKEAQMLLDSLNVMREALPALKGAQKTLIMDQMQTILSYFEEHQNEMPLGYSVTLGYYFQTDLSLK